MLTDLVLKYLRRLFSKGASKASWISSEDLVEISKRASAEGDEPPPTGRGPVRKG